MLQGIAVSQGIGLGRVMLLEEHSLAFDFSRSGGAQAERQRFHLAAESFRTHTARQVEQLRMCAGYEDSLILESHIDMACDPDLMDQVDRLIDEGACAEQAVQEACDGYIEIFSQSHDELTRLRAEDLRDVRSALLSILLGVEKPGLCQAPRGTVLVAKELSPSVMSDIDKENIVGIITETGGMVSHSSILARALGIPTVCGVAGAAAKLQKNSFVIVDGTRGEVICSPAANVIADYNQRREAFMAQRSRMKYFINRKTLSASGEEYSLACNITMPGGAARAAAVGADGVGLFRTEYLFMNRQTPPDEEGQFAAYTQALEGAEGRPVTIRTLDVGGDKNTPCLALPQEENPFLGLRGIRWCLANPEVFSVQLRALLRAGAEGSLRVMLPMVSALAELRQTKELLAKAAAQLTAQGVPHRAELPLGVMIETPAAALMADQLAQEADFFSIGTNDLTSYIMACDRGNPQVAELYHPLQPPLLRSLQHIIHCARQAGIPVTVCGEAAADHRMLPLLMAFGATGFSVPAGELLELRHVLSHWTLKDAQQLARQALDMDSPQQVEALLTEYQEEE